MSMRQELPRDVGAHTVAHSNSLGAARSSVQPGRCEGLPVLSGFYHKTTWKTMIVFGDRYHQISIHGGFLKSMFSYPEMEWKWFIDPARSPAGTPRRFGCKVLPRFQRHSRRVGILRTRNL